MAPVHLANFKSLIILVTIVNTQINVTRAYQDSIHDEDKLEYWENGFGEDFEGTHDRGGIYTEEGMYEEVANDRYTVDGEATVREHYDPENVQVFNGDEQEQEKRHDSTEQESGDFENAKDVRVCQDIEISFEKPKETFKWNKIADKEIYSFSAFYDARPIVGGPLVRVLSNGHQLMFHTDMIPLYCVFVFTGLKRAVSVLARYTSLYDSRAFRDEHTGHWVECPIPAHYEKKHNVPLSVTVLPSWCDPKPTFWLPIKVRKPRNDAKPRIALCTPVLYDGKDWVQIAEWIVLHKLLGYSTVYFYVKDWGWQEKMTNRIFRAYKRHRDSDISVVTVPWTSMDGCYYFCQHAVINECFYRAGLEHDYVTVADKDEVLMPQKHDTIPAFLSAIETDTTAAYLFQHVMFDEKRSENLTRESIIALSGIDIAGFSIDIKTFQPWTLTQKWHMERPYPAGRIRSKTIYNVNRTVSADIHFPKELVRPFDEIMVDPHDGVIYHYKTSAPKKWLNDVAYVYGSLVEKYQAKLLKGMIQLFKDLQ